MYEPKYNRESRLSFLWSGALGCLPSLLLFIAGSSGFPNVALLFFSFLFGVGGVSGLAASASMRGKENRSKEAAKRARALEEK